MQKTRVRSLGQEDPLEESMATHTNILAWRIPGPQRSLVGYRPWGCKELDTTEVTWQQQQRHRWASLVAQLVKNLPSMQKTWVQSPGWEDPLEKGKATHSSILA